MPTNRYPVHPRAFKHPHRPSAAHPNQAHWNLIRVQRLKLSGDRCETCDLGPEDGAMLECHHRTYERFGDEDLNDVRMLCSDCHTAITEVIMRRRENALKRYKSHRLTAPKPEYEKFPDQLPTPKPSKRREKREIERYPDDLKR